MGADVLLIDDSEADAVLFDIVATESDAVNQVRHFLSGPEALDYLRQPGNSRPDVIVLDLQMPEMSGREVLTELQKDPTLGQLPVIIMSSSDDAEPAEVDLDDSQLFISKSVGIAGCKEVINAIAALNTH